MPDEAERQRDALQAIVDKMPLGFEEAYAEGWDAGLAHDGTVPLGCYRPDWVTSVSKEALRRTASAVLAAEPATPTGSEI